MCVYFKVFALLQRAAKLALQAPVYTTAYPSVRLSVRLGTRKLESLGYPMTKTASLLVPFSIVEKNTNFKFHKVA